MDKQVAITGTEPFDGTHTAINALRQFYRAFNTQDLDLVQNNWINSPEAIMSNPLGGIKHGWDEISQVYQRIFNGPAE